MLLQRSQPEAARGRSYVQLGASSTMLLQTARSVILPVTALSELVSRQHLLPFPALCDLWTPQLPKSQAIKERNHFGWSSGRVSLSDAS